MKWKDLNPHLAPIFTKEVNEVSKHYMNWVKDIQESPDFIKQEEYAELRKSISHRIEEIDTFFELNFDKPNACYFEKGRIVLKKLLIFNPNLLSRFDNGRDIRGVSIGIKVNSNDNTNGNSSMISNSKNNTTNRLGFEQGFDKSRMSTKMKNRNQSMDKNNSQPPRNLYWDNITSFNDSAWKGNRMQRTQSTSTKYNNYNNEDGEDEYYDYVYNADRCSPAANVQPMYWNRGRSWNNNYNNNSVNMNTPSSNSGNKKNSNYINQNNKFLNKNNNNYNNNNNSGIWENEYQICTEDLGRSGSNLKQMNNNNYNNSSSYDNHNRANTKNQRQNSINMNTSDALNFSMNERGIFDEDYDEGGKNDFRFSINNNNGYDNCTDEAELSTYYNSKKEILLRFKLTEEEYRMLLREKVKNGNMSTNLQQHESWHYNNSNYSNKRKQQGKYY